jgi:hypothetical protein
VQTLAQIFEKLIEQRLTRSQAHYAATESLKSLPLTDSATSVDQRSVSVSWKPGTLIIC